MAQLGWIRWGLVLVLGAAACDCDEEPPPMGVDAGTDAGTDAGSTEEDGGVPMPSLILEPAEGLETGEDGATADVEVSLGSRPSSNVTIDLTSTNEAEVTVAPLSLTFTPENYQAPQTVRLTGVDDDRVDGPQEVTVATGPAVSEDASYSGFDGPDITVTNLDDDSAGFRVEPVEGLETDEDGGADTFTIVLLSAPSSDVLIGLSSTNEGEGTVAPSALTFTPDNWGAPQTATVTGVDDRRVDGDVAYEVTTAPAVSGDDAYDGLDPNDVAVVNADNDSAGVVVEPTMGLVTSEAGDSASFTVVLRSAPTGEVVVPISSDDEGEGAVDLDELTFTLDNWDAPQTVTVTGVDDDVADGDVIYQVEVGMPVSTDSNYAALPAQTVSLENTDDETAGVTVRPTAGLETTEAGGTDTFEVVLNSQPTAAVTISLASSDAEEATVPAASLVFTSMNWNAAQTVTVTGVDDDLADGAQPYRVTLTVASDDPDYDGLVTPEVQGETIDDETAGVTVDPVGGLVTTEAGATASFTIVLNSEPTDDVTIPLSSDDVSEGTVSISEVVFTPLNWNSAQTVEVTGQDDFSADGDKVYRVVTGPASSSDPNYAMVDAADVEVSNTDNETAGVAVSPTTGLTTTEAFGTAEFTIVLNSGPAGEVRIPLTSSDPGEGTITRGEVVFTTDNWNSPVTVTVTGADDDVADGAQTYRIVTGAATSADPDYSGRDPADVTLRNTDDETAGITVDAAPLLSTSETGTTAEFTVVLDSEPTADVVIPLSSRRPTEGLVSPAELRFTSENWNAPQTVTVTGVDDMIRDGTQRYTIALGAAVSSDPGYAGQDPDDVVLTNADDETGAVLVNADDLVTGEDGSTDAFTVVLNSAPTADVTVPVASNATDEATPSPLTLTFTPATWDIPQTVTATGVDDDVADGDQVYFIRLGLASSADPNFDRFNTPDVRGTNIDNDTAGIRVTPVDGLSTTELGGADTFSIELNSEPTARVTIPLRSSDTGEGTVAASVSFDATNWNVAQIVSVTGVDDDVADGDQVFFVRTDPATSADRGYSGLDGADVEVTNQDDDSPGIVVTPTRGLRTNELGATAEFTVVLTSEPTAAVTIDLTSSNPFEGTVSPASLVFTAMNWDEPQTVTLTGQDDVRQDGSQLYIVVTSPAVSSDDGYAGRNPQDVEAVNIDDETAGITVTLSASPLTTTEAGGTATFTVVLDREPTAPVSIDLTSTNLLEGTVSPASLTFSPTDWFTPQTVTVTGEDDAVADGDQFFAVLTEPATSADTTYSGVNASDVPVINTDDE